MIPHIDHWQTDLGSCMMCFSSFTQRSGNTAPACLIGVKIADREDNSWLDGEESADVDGDEHPTGIEIVSTIFIFPRRSGKYAIL